ncbi:MAG TPA: cyclase family protein [Candidatus Nanopelagicaceae bacterium]|nr:cyclase family protein [Candidatus Nanopelagicaceae bacterium]
MLNGAKVIDLTIPLGEGIVMWPGAPAPEAETLVTVSHDGYFARKVSFFEHSGTHFDAPCHFIEGHTTVDKVPVESLVRAAAVIDISARIGDDADGELSLQDVHSFESAHGRIPDGAAVLLRTGWEEFNGDERRYAGAEGDLRFPGFGVEAAKFLVAERKIGGLGTDTLGIDLGRATDFPVHTQVTLPKGIWHLENLQNLRALPPLGAWIVVGVLPLIGGSGSPARVIALLP